MAYSEELAQRVRDELGGVTKVTEQAMFGGLAWMVAGNMAVGVNGDDLIVRLDPTLHHDALTRPNAREMDFTGRSMKGFVAVGPGSVIDDGELELWVRLGVTWAKSLPPKAKKAAKKKKKAPAKKVATKAKKATTKVAARKVAKKAVKKARKR
jgi:TfoX/Sxy family transcriptional regulator of competence genes